MSKYYYISLKWTHKEDAVYIFWSPNSQGYTISLDGAGVYEKELNNYDVKSVRVEDVNRYCEHVRYYAHIYSVLPNSKQVRDVLNIKKKDLDAAYPHYPFCDFAFKDNYRFIDQVDIVKHFANGDVIFYDKDGIAINKLKMDAGNKDMALYKAIVNKAEDFYISGLGGQEFCLDKQTFSNITNLNE